MVNRKWWISTVAGLMAAFLGTGMAHADGNKPAGKGAAGGRPSPEMMQKIIAKFDTDGDGKLNEAERQAAKAARGTGRQGGKSPAGKGVGGKGGPNPEMMQKLIARFDTDGDGKLSESERQAARAAKGSFGGAGGKPGLKKPKLK